MGQEASAEREERLVQQEESSQADHQDNRRRCLREVKPWEVQDQTKDPKDHNQEEDLIKV